MPLRDQLVEMIGEGILEYDGKIQNDTSLIRSGLIDSLGLFKLALWIEMEIGSTLQIASLDPSNEWDTMADILKFVENRRR
jgi:acyl carrier protein